jgi:hypothetical protein
MAQHSTVEQLRADVDRGRTGDKIDFPDPAAAPLGTDEEAAGTPIDGRLVAQVRQAEGAASKRVVRNRGLGAAWILIGFIAVVATGIATWVWLL